MLSIINAYFGKPIWGVIIDKKTIGECIRKNRLKMGLTQAQLAEIILVSENQIGNYERGVAIPDRDHLFALAKTLHFSMDALISSDTLFGGYFLPEEINELMNNLNQKQRKIVIRTITAVIEALME